MTDAPGADAGWEVEARWKEQLWYREGADAFCFDCGWGVSPLVAYIPSERIWDGVVPPFLVGRRAEVLDRLRAANDRHGHVLEDTEVGYGPRRPDRPRRSKRKRDRE